MIFHWLILSLFLFSTGIYGLLTRRSAVGLLISVELMLNSGALNLTLFNRVFAAGTVDGQIFSIFVIAIAASEVLIGIAILMMLFNKKASVDITRLSELKN
jgi:NADH-quinone oxidoreductase subunit K